MERKEEEELLFPVHDTVWRKLLVKREEAAKKNTAVRITVEQITQDKRVQQLQVKYHKQDVQVMLDVIHLNNMVWDRSGRWEYRGEEILWLFDSK